MSLFTRYYHHGDTGDTIAALPLILSRVPGASRRGGPLFLYPAPGKVREPYSPEKVEKVRSFFESQPLVRRCEFAPGPPHEKHTGDCENVVLDVWRKQGFRRPLNLADLHSQAFRVPHWPREAPFITVNPRPVAEVVFSRSERYRVDDFPWGELVAGLGRRAVFVGTEVEHRDFCDRFGEVPHYPTPTLLDLAEVVAGALFSAHNQSTPLWLRLGTCLPLYCERNRRHDNCHWLRSNAFYGREDWGRVVDFLDGLGLTGCQRTPVPGVHRRPVGLAPVRRERPR